MVSKSAVAFLVGAAAVGLTAVAVVSAKTPPPTNKVLTSLKLAATSGTQVLVGGTVAFDITALDQAGMPMAGVSGQITEGGTAVSGGFTTDASGMAAFSLQFPAAGTFQIAASSGGVTSSVVTVTVSTAVAVLTSLTLSASAATVAAGGSLTFTVTAKDQNGSSMPGVSGQITEGGTPVAGGGFTTGTGGVASLSLQFPSQGTFQVGAASGGIASNVVTITVTPPTYTGPTVLTAVLTSVPPDVNGTVNVVANAYTQFWVLADVAVGQLAQGIPVSWYVDGATVYVPPSGAALTTVNQPSEGTAGFGKGFAAGTHTVYAIVGNLQTRTITVVAV